MLHYAVGYEIQASFVSLMCAKDTSGKGLDTTRKPYGWSNST